MSGLTWLRQVSSGYVVLYLLGQVRSVYFRFVQFMSGYIRLV
jgi:hypothetical protein